MNELFLYDRDAGLFKAILNASSVIQGRYFILVSGSDLNSSNLGQYISDSLNGIKTPDQKYPAAFLLPPRTNPADKRLFAFTMLFLTRDGATGTNELKDVNVDQQVSMHPTWYDWKDMAEVATNFTEMLNKVIRTRYAQSGEKLSSLTSFEKSSTAIDPISNVTNDNLSGVRLSFRMLMSADCEVNDYEATAVDDIVIPSFNIHPLH